MWCKSFGSALIISALLGLAVLGSAPLQAQTAAHELVKGTTGEVLEELRNRREELQDHPGKIYDFVQEYLLPHFDFERMSRLALGKHWRRIDDVQRERFMEEFRRLLVRTYATSMLKYSDQEIRFLPYHGKPDSRSVTVNTEVERAGGSPIPIDYSLYEADGSWKVYDVTIDNVSLVINYRSTFSSQIARLGGVDELIDKLKERNARLMNE